MTWSAAFLLTASLNTVTAQRSKGEPQKPGLTWGPQATAASITLETRAARFLLWWLPILALSVCTGNHEALEVRTSASLLPVTTSNHSPITKVHGLLHPCPPTSRIHLKNPCVSTGRHSTASCFCFSADLFLLSWWSCHLYRKNKDSFSRRMKNESQQLQGTHLSVLHWYPHYHDSGYLATMPFYSRHLYSDIFVFLLAWGNVGHNNISLFGHGKVKYLSENLEHYFSSSLKKQQQQLFYWCGSCTCLTSLLRHAPCQVRVCKKYLQTKTKTTPHPKSLKNKTLRFSRSKSSSY